MGNLISIIVIAFIVFKLLSNKKKAATRPNDASRVSQYKQINAATQQKKIATERPATKTANTNLVATKSAIPAPNAKIPTQRVQSQGVSNYSPAHAPKKKSNSTAINALMDDRENDWLANQLRDEHRAFKVTSAMFGLKIEHASHCDAKYIRDFHHANCSAEGIDTAKGK